MPTQLPSGRPDQGVPRRSVLRGAAGLGAVGLAAAAGAGAVVAATRPAGSGTVTSTGATQAAGAAARANGTEPLVVYLRDAAAGEFEVFHGTRQVRLRNPGLAAQLLDGIATAQ
jgi:hypothetical protein